MGLIFRDDEATFPLAYTFNTTTGKIRFIAPTYVIANNAEPPDVWIYQPITTNNLYAVYPGDTIGPPQTPNYSGTSNSVDGLRKTLTVTIDQWTDPGQFGTYGPSGSGMQLYAYDLWSSVSDSVIEGEVVYYGFYAPALVFGNALAIAGMDTDQNGVAGPAYTTGWEGLNLPIREVQIEWPQFTGQDYITSMRVSNRRDVYSVDQFLKPARQAGYSLGMVEGSGGNPFGIMPSTEGMEASVNVVMPDFAPRRDFSFDEQVSASRGTSVGEMRLPRGQSRAEHVGESDRGMVDRAFEQWKPPAGHTPSSPGSSGTFQLRVPGLIPSRTGISRGIL